MKKQYEKPMLAVEYYQLSQSIAACVTRINYQSSDCVTNDSDSTEEMTRLAGAGFFVDQICTLSSVGMDANDKICYHTNANAAFTS